MNTRSNLLFILVGLVFEYFAFSPLWNKYDVNIFDFFEYDFYAVMGLAALASFILFLFYTLIEKYNANKNQMNKLIFITLGIIIIFSFTSFYISKSSTVIIEDPNFNFSQRHYRGFLLDKTYSVNYENCKAMNINFYECFEGLEKSPWKFPDLIKDFLYVITAILIAVVYGLGWMVYVRIKLN